MKLIKDLGVTTNPNSNTSKKRYRFGEYECPNCLEHVIVRTACVTNGDSTQCRTCADKDLVEPRRLAAANAFKDKAVAIHGDRYNYDNTYYITTRLKVSIYCNKCEKEFDQTPDRHLSGSGCRRCSASSFNDTLPAILYYFKIDEVYKIGITNRDLTKRYKAADRKRMSEIQVFQFDLGSDAYNIEQEVIKSNKEFAYKGDTPFIGGTLVSECFYKDIGVSCVVK